MNAVFSSLNMDLMLKPHLPTNPSPPPHLRRPLIVTSPMMIIINNGVTLFNLGMFSEMNDEELDDFVRSTQQSHPNIGIRMLKGLLHSNGHRVQRERIRHSLLRTDPIGVIQ